VTSRGEFRAPGVGHVRSACPVPQLSAAYVRGLSRGLISLVTSRDAGLRQPAMAPGACALLRRALLALAETRLHCLTAEYGILGVSRVPLCLAHLSQLDPAIVILLVRVYSSATKRRFFVRRAQKQHWTAAPPRAGATASRLHWLAPKLIAPRTAI
jgi:hypothetical protein